MKITDLIHKDSVNLNVEAHSKAEAIAKAVELMGQSGNILDLQKYQEAVLKREEEGSTGIGDGVAIPHAKSKAVKQASVSAIVFPKGVDFDALDGEKVKVLFMIAAPEGENNTHLEILSQLSELLMQPKFIDDLALAKNVEEFFDVIDRAQAGLLQKDQKKDQEGQFEIIAVTACPTGIAHTYMAAQALESKACEMGIAIKVETRGSSGVKNALTQEDIQNAKCVIVAADTQTPIERFSGKKVIFCKVADGIHKSKELLERGLAGEGEVLVGQGETVVKNESAHGFYKPLMSGVSHMLPFVVGGGLLIALAFLIDGFYIDMENASEGIRKAFGSNNELAAFFMNLGKLAFGFILPILSGFIAKSIADRPALLVGFVGGAIASGGKSGFLGALLAGFLAGYIILGLKQLFAKLPHSLDGVKPILFYPVFGTLIIGILMFFVVEPPVGILNTALNNELNSMGEEWKILLGVILGGMMATDLGGPINKAAYVFGVASIPAGNYDIMAAVMIGGMVPPLAIALATFIFPNRFTLEEQKGGMANIVMGLSFITEGAIPFAAADPLRVLGSCIVASAIAGGLSMYFSCTLMAPHGGIFVFPVVGGVGYYLLSLVIGSVIGAVLLGILKEKKC